MILWQGTGNERLARILEIGSPHQRNLLKRLERKISGCQPSNGLEPVPVEWYGSPGVGDDRFDLAELCRKQRFRRPPLALFELELQRQMIGDPGVWGGGPDDALPSRTGYSNGKGGGRRRSARRRW